MPDRTLQVGVKVLLRNPDGKFLVLRRSSEKYPEVPNPWEIPGGRIEVGATLLENLQREVSEETGLTVHGEPELLAAQDILRIEDKHVVRLTYVAETTGEPTLSDEHTDFRWMTAPEMLAIETLDVYLREVLESNPV